MQSPVATPQAVQWTPARLGAILAVAVFLIYANSLFAPFIFDDEPAILSNLTIRHLRAIGSVLSPPDDGSGVTGRPLMNLSLAVNYALGRLDVRGYHLANVLLHALCTLALFGLVRRTLQLCSGQALLGVQNSTFNVQSSATGLAFFCAFLWSVHPLLTESVVCVVQRNEVLAALFYLLTLYCFIRYADRPQAGDRRWAIASCLSCLAGMASKEIVASAPVMVFLYDRTFVAGSFREAWRTRWRYYFGLASTWLLLGYLILGTGGNRAGTVGFGLGMSSWHYLLAQCRAIVMYLKLCFWPHPLVLDYGTAVEKNLSAVWPQALALVVLLGASLWAFWRRPKWGFVGLFFFALLAPSSSVLPLTTQTMAEHRMYLPLAAVIALLTIAVYGWLGRRSLYVGLVAAVALGTLTVLRNKDYSSAMRIWADTAAKCPDNPRAHNNLGEVLDRVGRVGEAIGEYREALRLDPNYYTAHNNLGNALTQINRVEDALGEYEKALHLRPDYAAAHLNLGSALDLLDRSAEAIAHYKIVLQLQPDSSQAHYNLGNTYMRLGRLTEAVHEYQECLRLDPQNAAAHNNLGSVFYQQNHFADAVAQFRAALEIDPDNSDARSNLTVVLTHSP